MNRFQMIAVPFVWLVSVGIWLPIQAGEIAPIPRRLPPAGVNLSEAQAGQLSIRLDLSEDPNAVAPGKIAAADFFDESWKPRRSDDK